MAKHVLNYGNSSVAFAHLINLCGYAIGKGASIGPVNQTWPLSIRNGYTQPCSADFSEVFTANSWGLDEPHPPQFLWSMPTLD